MEDIKKEISDEAPKKQEEEKSSVVMKDHNTPSSKPEEDVIKRKYGGLLSKKHPLISKDHERAFFDSADWALGKQKGQKPKGPLEALRPKLQPTPHQQLRTRRMAYASGDASEDFEDDNSMSLDDHRSSGSAVGINDGLEDKAEEGDMKGNSDNERKETS